MSDLVGNPEDRFSHVAAHMVSFVLQMSANSVICFILSRTSEEHKQWIYVIFILVGQLSITVICGLYLNIRGFKTVRFFVCFQIKRVGQVCVCKLRTCFQCDQH